MKITTISTTACLSREEILLLFISFMWSPISVGSIFIVKFQNFKKRIPVKWQLKPTLVSFKGGEYKKKMIDLLTV